MTQHLKAVRALAPLSTSFGSYAQNGAVARDSCQALISMDHSTFPAAAAPILRLPGVCASDRPIPFNRNFTAVSHDHACDDVAVNFGRAVKKLDRKLSGFAKMLYLFSPCNLTRMPAAATSAGTAECRSDSASTVPRGSQELGSGLHCAAQREGGEAVQLDGGPGAARRLPRERGRGRSD